MGAFANSPHMPASTPTTCAERSSPSHFTVHVTGALDVIAPAARQPVDPHSPSSLRPPARHCCRKHCEHSQHWNRRRARQRPSIAFRRAPRSVTRRTRTRGAVGSHGSRDRGIPRPLRRHLSGRRSARVQADDAFFNAVDRDLDALDGRMQGHREENSAVRSAIRRRASTSTHRRSPCRVREPTPDRACDRRRVAHPSDDGEVRSSQSARHRVAIEARCALQPRQIPTLEVVLMYDCA